MRIVFAGTPAPAVPSFEALMASSHEIAAVVTRPDAPLGRKRVVTPSPVGEAADARGIPTIKSSKLDDDATRRIEALEADLGVIVAYGGLVREPLLSAPRLGWINLHFSLLPRWRGAAPVQHALIAGDAITGVTVFQLVPELDAGDILASSPLDVPPLATAGSLLDTLAIEGATVLVGVVNALAEERAMAQPQMGQVTLAPKIALDDARIRWEESQDAVLNRVRGVTPEPGAFTLVGGARIKVLSAHRAELKTILRPGVVRAFDGEVAVGTATEPIVLTRVQPAGKPAMNATDWWRGLRTDELRTDS
ncbi:methionyl-tRNA formyltransferase [Microbacterium endophyticum]|uniref:Methionyl-tRNA formyltransferase n=1 Tax=Microbacterium endophyticum TaxID=1526412 RepID=A0A7W4V552_9MICO|nr:methionyl-tRNA formyltransferase [Microbacterium endophyticum]MBB2977042.1 methionyl-tRNA formyltransferase [Microbacterium endophyticum]NIK36672.1 methionyl-tRNA formyltransferase [Microbacterium endophyticum]